LETFTMQLSKAFLLIAATALAACGSSPNASAGDSLAAAVPDGAGISLEATGAASEDVTLSDTSEASVAADGGAASGLTFLPVIRQGIHDLNQGLETFFGPIGQLISTQGKDIVVGTSKTYGPVDQGGVTYLLTVKRFAPNRYAWKLEGKTTGAAVDVALTTLAVGTLFHASNDEAHRGRGQIGVDLDAFASVSPGFMGQGKLYGAYSNYEVSGAGGASGLAGDAKTVVYVLKNFSIDTSAHPPISAAFVGHKTLAGVRDARVLYYGELPEFVGTPDHAELLLGRARFNPGVGGRADALVTGGDVPSGVFIYGAECWDVSEDLGWRKVWSCTSLDPNSCTVESEQGNVMACAVDLRDDMPEAPTDGTSSALDNGAPDPSVSPITAMPSFDNPS
jgi:hypothetical protein